MTLDLLLLVLAVLSAGALVLFAAFLTEDNPKNRARLRRRK